MVVLKEEEQDHEEKADEESQHTSWLISQPGLQYELTLKLKYGQKAENEEATPNHRHICWETRSSKVATQHKSKLQRSTGNYSSLFPEARHMNDFAHLCQRQYLCLRTYPHTFHFISSNLRQTTHYKVCCKNTHFFSFIQHILLRTCYSSC